MSKGMPLAMERSVIAGQVAGRYRFEVNKVLNVAATGGAVGIGTTVLGNLPSKELAIIAAVAELGFSTADTDVIAAWNGDYALGTGPDSDGTLDTDGVNIIPSTAIGPATARVIAPTRGRLAAPFNFDNSGGAAELNLNMLIDAADITDDEDADITVIGYVDLLLGQL